MPLDLYFVNGDLDSETNYLHQKNDFALLDVAVQMVDFVLCVYSHYDFEIGADSLSGNEIV
jgi:elongation factor P hydroxylase